MMPFRLRLAALAVAALLAIGAASALAAPTAPPPSSPAVRAQEGQAAEHRVEPVLLWTAVGVAIGGLALGVLYLLKRQVGGFPEHPSWVAPITIMPSRELPGDTDSHEATAPGDEHAAHHAPAH